MEIVPLAIPDVLLIRPRVHGDERGFFVEVWQQERYAAAGIGPFLQLNHSRSAQGILRGLHFQWERPQGKLVRLVAGRIFDVAVDLRPESPHFGQWVGHTLTAASQEQLWIPPRFAHGFCVLEGPADFEYLCTQPFMAHADAGLRWNDPRLAVAWPLDEPRLSQRDQDSPQLDELEPLIRQRWTL
jgi:dTDP-4-dehydrorhamnose 3,5-epimerase